MTAVRSEITSVIVTWARGRLHFSESQGPSLKHACAQTFGLALTMRWNKTIPGCSTFCVVVTGSKMVEYRLDTYVHHLANGRSRVALRRHQDLEVKGRLTRYHQMGTNKYTLTLGLGTFSSLGINDFFSFSGGASKVRIPISSTALQDRSRGRLQLTHPRTRFRRPDAREDLTPELIESIPLASARLPNQQALEPPRKTGRSLPTM